MQPSVIEHGDLLQLSYDLPHHVYDSVVYPLKSSNGSAIILYGHEDGLRIIWYGGKPFQQNESAGRLLDINGASKSEPMVIDLSDDDEDKPKVETLPTRFEDAESEVDPKRPFRDILRHIDVSLGTAVTHITTPKISSHNLISSPDSYPDILKSQIVVATACADMSIHTIALPLDPPAPDIQGTSKWNVQNAKIHESNGHLDFITSISLTHTAETTDSEVNASNNTSRSRSRNRHARSEEEWKFIVASTSNTGSGLLLIHQIPISKRNTLITSADIFVPIQRQYMRCSLSSCKLSFNSSPYRTAVSSNLLIALPDCGCVKIYQVFPKRSPVSGRRESAATTDSTGSSSRSTRTSLIQQGKFLITLYPSFKEDSVEPLSLPQRKRLLDTAWVLGGRAILALLEDGEWGVWDLEAAGPASSATTPNLVQGQSKVSDLQGGSLTKFAIKSTVTSATWAGASTVSGKTKSAKTNGLVPMTPHTRRVRPEGLFRSDARSSTTSSSSASGRHGSVYVQELVPSSSTKSSRVPDESILINYGDTNGYLPSLLHFWRASSLEKGTLDSASSNRLLTLPAVRLGGQRQKSITTFPQNTKASGGLFGTTQSVPDMLITTPHRLIMLLSPLTETADTDSNVERALMAKTADTDMSGAADHMLDIEGIDQVLNGMDGRKSIGFHPSIEIDMI